MIKSGSYTVYMHRGKLADKKVYIGTTMRNPEVRFASGRGYNHNKTFNDDIIKYGWNNFEHIILETGLCREEAMKREEYYIRKYKATNISFGYNRDNKSKTQTIEDRQKMSKSIKASLSIPEIKNKLSNSHKGLKMSNETKTKISKANKGHKVSKEVREKISLGNKGKVMSEESRQKMRESSKNRNLTPELRAKFATMKGKHHTQESKNKIKEANKGRIYVNNGIEDKMIKSEQLDEYIANGFVVGHLVSNDARNKMSEPTKGTIWINNGEIVKRIKPNQLDDYLKQGYIVGRKMKGSD